MGDCFPRLLWDLHFHRSFKPHSTKILGLCQGQFGGIKSRKKGFLNKNNPAARVGMPPDWFWLYFQKYRLFAQSVNNGADRRGCGPVSALCTQQRVLGTRLPVRIEPRLEQAGLLPELAQVHRPPPGPAHNNKPVRDNRVFRKRNRHQADLHTLQKNDAHDGGDGRPGRRGWR